jgi:hypothetical protein
LYSIAREERKMRIAFALLCLIFIMPACSDDPSENAPPADNGGPDGSGFITNQRIIFSDGLHSENTEMIRLGDRILLCFRGGEEGQTGSARARIMVFESMDNGQTFSLISEVSMPDDPDDPDDDRDIRDPKFVQIGDTLFMYAISRVPGFKYRDLFGEAWTVRAESTDGGHTWTTPVKTLTDPSPLLGRLLGFEEDYWGVWRLMKREYEEAGQEKMTLYATAYNDGDMSVGLFASEDGRNWRKVALIHSAWDDIPSEAELQFFGENNEKAVSLVRMDNQGNLTDGQTAICTSSAPFTAWECGRRIEQRLDGPTWVVLREGSRVRNFVFARKHLPCTFKRTTAYELRGDLTNPNAPVEVCEIQDVASSGDTAYTALVPLSDDKYLLSWYTSPVDQELAWLEGQFSPSDIWLADVDFSRAPSQCRPPEPESICDPATLPPGEEVFDVSGEHFLAMSPVIWPSEPVYFTANVTVKGATLDFTLQPLDRASYIDQGIAVPVGGSWTVRDVPFEGDGSFTVDFGSRSLPAAAYPVIDETIPLSLEDFVLKGKTTSPDSFCGGIEGYVQVLPLPLDILKADVILIYGSKFGATRMDGPALPEPVSTCP